MKFKIIFSALVLTMSATFGFAQETSMQKASKSNETTAKKIGVGDLAPDFSLSDQNGKTVKLSEAVKTAPVVLVFYRGYWCPFCAQQLSDLRKLLKSDDQAQLFAVSIDPADKSRELIKKIEKDGKAKFNYLLLSDPNAQTIDVYGLRDDRYAGEKVDGIPFPTVYVVGKDQKIVWAKIERDYKQRPTNEEIRTQLEQISGAK